MAQSLASKPIHAMGTEESLGRLEVDPDVGLSAAEAERRLGRHGPNRLPGPPPRSLLSQLYGQLADITVLALLAAAFIALGAALLQGGGLARYGDTGAIMGIVVLNAILGILQQRRADRALLAIKDLTAPSATVIREGREHRIPATAVVPGDLLAVAAGDRVAADARLLRSKNLVLGEEMLTGDPSHVEKHSRALRAADLPLSERANMLHAGTVVEAGEGVAVVVATGTRTEMGRVAARVREADAVQTPLERDLGRFGVIVVIGCVVISAAVFAVGALGGRHPLHEMFLIAICLAVAAIPEGLPAVSTIVLALGTRAMARRGALVRRLGAVETLGCAQVICTDKTGTLTRSQMRVQRLALQESTWLAHRVQPLPDDLCAAADVMAGARGRAPTDQALRRAGRELGSELVDAEVADEVVFTPERRTSSTVFVRDEQFLVCTRGGFERVLDICDLILDDGRERPLTDEDRNRIADRAEAWAAESLRVIGLARRKLEQRPEGTWESELVFVGLAGLADPLRGEVKLAVQRTLQAGIRLIMVTGDHFSTARAVAVESGILTPGSEVITGGELSRLSDGELDERLDRISVVARATAAHKQRIVESLGRRGEVSCVTGSGLMDAPVLRRADVGVAMGCRGTDVAREAADMVLADDNFATIVVAISEGRAIYANIRRFITFLFASNVGLVFAVATASVFGWMQPLAPIQILWINLITNGLPALALGLEPSQEDHMTFPPRRPEEPILRPGDAFQICVVGGLIAGGGLWAFHEAAHPAAARTAAFSVFALAPLLFAFSARSEEIPLWRLRPLSNRLLVGAVCVGVGLQAIALLLPATRVVFRTAPMSLADWGRVFLASVIPFVLVEVWKIVAGRGVNWR